MKVEQVMTSRTACLNSSNTIYDAALAMQKHNIGFIPVCDNESLVGVLTDRDVVVRAISQGKDPSITPVEEIMTKEVHRVSLDTSMTEVADIMSEYKIRRLPVTDDERLVGVISIGDIATHDGTHSKAKRALSDISSPSAPINM